MTCVVLMARGSLAQITLPTRVAVDIVVLMARGSLTRITLPTRVTVDIAVLMPRGSRALGEVGAMAEGLHSVIDEIEQ
jgi:hypothetical protein